MSSTLINLIQFRVLTLNGNMYRCHFVWKGGLSETRLDSPYDLLILPGSVDRTVDWEHNSPFPGLVMK